MKFKIVLMLIILGILSVMPMIYMGKFDPVALIDSGVDIDFDLSRFTPKVPEKLKSVVTDKKVHVYKWRDENGVMQFSNEPPPPTVAAEQIVLDPNSNVIPAVKVAEKEVAVKPMVREETPNSYSVNGMKKVMDGAKGLEQVLQNRHEEQQKAVNNL